jgi:hypothetical protein
MDSITVNKTDLIKRLQENRAEHHGLFLEAQQVYREQMIHELDRALAEAREGGKIRRLFSMPVPEDHTDDFDTAVRMLEWHQGDTVTLSQYEFTEYVENKWGWRASFAANTESYTQQVRR